MATALTGADLVRKLSGATGLPQSDVRLILDAHEEVVVGALKKAKQKDRVTVLPGALTVYKNRKKATKARDGINPFTGEPMRIKAKPARTVVKASVLKRLKESV